MFDAVAEQVQTASDYEDGNALDVFESYRGVKRKVQEKKISRGFKPTAAQSVSGSGSRWQLQGSIRGKTEAIKGRTMCHLCKRVGHWKRECSMRNNKNKPEGKGGHGDDSAKGSDVHITEVLVIDEYELARESGKELTGYEDHALKDWTKIVEKSCEAEELKDGSAAGLKDSKRKGRRQKGDEWQLQKETNELWRVHHRLR